MIQNWLESKHGRTHNKNVRGASTNSEKDSYSGNGAFDEEFLCASPDFDKTRWYYFNFNYSQQFLLRGSYLSELYMAFAGLIFSTIPSNFYRTIQPRHFRVIYKLEVCSNLKFSTNFSPFNLIQHIYVKNKNLKSKNRWGWIKKMLRLLQIYLIISFLLNKGFFSILKCSKTIKLIARKKSFIKNVPYQKRCLKLSKIQDFCFGIKALISVEWTFIVWSN